LIKKLICHKCGAVNVIDTLDLEKDESPGHDGKRRDWLDCLPPEGFEWKLPAGKITPIYGDPIYITATGLQLSQYEYMARYVVDPEKALKMMRGMGTTVRDSVKTGEDLTKGNSKVPGSIKKMMDKLNRTQVKKVR